MSMDIELRKMLKKVGMDFFQKFYGDYNGYVADNIDPSKQGRVKLKVPAIYGNDTHDFWATPKGMPNGSNEGMFWIPKIGDAVLVSFENGNCRFPMWQHGYWGTKDDRGNSVLAGLYDDDGKPTKRQITTAGGHTVLFDDKNKILDIVDMNGQHVTMDQDALVLLSSKLITLGAKDASHPAVLGDKEKDLWNAVLDALAAATVVVSGSPVPLTNATDFTVIKASLVEPILSTLVKLKK